MAGRHSLLTRLADGRQHRWQVVGQVQLAAPAGMRDLLRCRRCRQTHEVAASMTQWTTGRCPRVPLRYRLRMWRQRQNIPSWPPQQRPPWEVAR